jgi:hypothetical protein
MSEKSAKSVEVTNILGDQESPEISAWHKNRRALQMHVSGPADGSREIAEKLGASCRLPIETQRAGI